ncbi:response regulator [Acidipila rosea]|nr:PAS domain S-box protein [Acidipila rosea]
MPRTLRILHIEDSALDAELVEAAIRAAGISASIDKAGTRACLVEKLMNHQYDLALSDNSMPDLSGVDALQICRDLQPEMDFIFASGTLTEEASQAGLSSGAFYHVAKEQLGSLGPVIRNLMRMREERQQSNNLMRALRATENKLDIALEAARLGLWSLDIKTLKLECSAQCKRNNGRLPTDPFTFEELAAAVHADDQPAFRSAVEASIKELSDFKVEHRSYWPDGSLHWIAASGRVVMDAEGRPSHLTGVSIDITEQKRAEEEVRQAEALQRDILNDLPCAVALFSSDQHYLYTNPAYQSMFEGRSTQVGITLAEVVGSEAHKKLSPRIEKVLAGEPIDFEDWITYASGERRFVKVSLVPLLKKNSGHSGFLAMITDATRERLTEEALRINEERFRGFFLEAGVAMVITTASGEFRNANDAYCALTGYSREELLNRNFADLTHPDDLAKNKVLYEETVTGARPGFVIEKRYLRKDGETIWVVVHGSPLRGTSGAETEIIGICEDITARHNAEEALRNSEFLYRATFEHTSVGICHVDSDGHFLRVNDRMCEITGYDREELLRKTFPEITHPQDAGYDLLSYRELVAGRIPRYSYEKRYIHKQGHSVWVYLTVSFLRDGDGKPLHSISIIEDITARKHAEEALRHSEKLAVVGRLASSIAHEINNPLESVTNLLYLLNLQPSLSAESRTYLKQAEEELARVSAIASQTLSFHRQPAQAASAEINVLLDSVLTLYQGRFASAGIELQRRYRTTPPLLCRANELRQLFANLIGNAFDATRKGGRILVRLRPYHDRTAQRTGVLVTIADTGHGMSPQVQRHIFEPFFSTKEAHGTGLGLSISRDIVEKHNGRIRVRSSEGPERSGTVISVFLPEPVSPKPHSI